MTKTFYVFSEENDTRQGPFPAFYVASEEIDDDDDYSYVFAVEDGRIIEVHHFCGGAFDNDTDSAYLGMNIEDVG